MTTSVLQKGLREPAITNKSTNQKSHGSHAMQTRRKNKWIHPRSQTTPGHRWHSRLHRRKQSLSLCCDLGHRVHTYQFHSWIQFWCSDLSLAPPLLFCYSWRPTPLSATPVAGMAGTDTIFTDCLTHNNPVHMIQERTLTMFCNDEPKKLGALLFLPCAHPALLWHALANMSNGPTVARRFSVSLLVWHALPCGPAHCHNRHWRTRVKWLQEYIEKLVMLNKQRRWFHYLLRKLWSECLRIGFWCQHIWFTSWFPHWFCQITNQEQLCGFWKHVSLSDFFPLWSSWSLLRCLQTDTTRRPDEKIGRLREHSQYYSARWSSLEIFDFCQW